MNKRILWVGVISFFLVGLAVAITLFLAKPADFRGTAYGEPYPAAVDFELTKASGDVFRLSDQRNKIVLLFFGYTTCPDVCPTTLAEMNLALSQIPEKADRVQVVFVSVDPERDTPEVVQKYVSRFNPLFIGLSGSFVELQKIWNDYGIFREVAQSDSAAGYLVNHTARVILIDTDGNMRLSYGFDTPVEDVVHDLKLLLK